MNTAHHTSRRAAAKLVRSWWDNHQHLHSELEARRRDAKIASTRLARGQTKSDAQWVQEEIERLDSQIRDSAQVGERLYNHPRTRNCFNAPGGPTKTVVAWSPPAPVVVGFVCKGAYSRRAYVRDMKRSYGPDWWRCADSD